MSNEETQGVLVGDEFTHGGLKLRVAGFGRTVRTENAKDSVEVVAICEVVSFEGDTMPTWAQACMGQDGAIDYSLPAVRHHRKVRA